MTENDPLRLLLVTDVHFEFGYHKGVYEGTAMRWLFRQVNRNKPDVILGLGDWGSAWTEENFARLTDAAKVYSLLGNHDNAAFLAGLTNLDGENVLARDGEVKEIGGVRFGFIHGVVRHSPEGPRFKSRDEFLRLSRELGGKVDVLLTHISPMRSEFSDLKYHTTLNMGSEILQKVKPLLSFSGHMHPRRLGSETIGSSTNFLLDSSQKTRAYATMEVPWMNVKLWKDSELVAERNFDLKTAARDTGRELPKRIKCAASPNGATRIPTTR